MAHEIENAARQLVIERAGRRCECCLLRQDSAGFPHEIDHIISPKHGGSSGIGNLAYACVICDRYKGTDIASIDRTGATVRFFDPRRDSWDEHFKLQGAVIEPLTAVGEVTARILRLNAAERVIERRLFAGGGAVPHAIAPVISPACFWRVQELQPRSMPGSFKSKVKPALNCETTCS